MMIKRIAPIIFLLCSAALQVQGVIMTLDVFANEHGAVVINLGDGHFHFPSLSIEEFEGIACILKEAQNDIELILEARDYSNNVRCNAIKLLNVILILKAFLIGAQRTLFQEKIQRGLSSLMLMNMYKHELDFYNEKLAVKPLDDFWLSIPKKLVDVRCWMDSKGCFIELKKCHINKETVNDLLRTIINCFLSRSCDASIDLSDDIIALRLEIVKQLNCVNQIIAQVESSINNESSILQEARSALLRLIELSKVKAKILVPIIVHYFDQLEKTQDVEQFNNCEKNCSIFTAVLLADLIEIKAFLQVVENQIKPTRSIVCLGAAHIREKNDLYYDVPEFTTILVPDASSRPIEQLALACGNHYDPGLNDLLSLNGYTKLASYNLLASAFDADTKEFTPAGCRKVIEQLKEKLSYWVTISPEDIIQLVKADQEKEAQNRARACEQRKAYKKYREQRYKSPEFIQKKRLADLEEDIQSLKIKEATQTQ